MLQAQLSLERQKRVAVEEEYGLALKENSQLEQQLGAAGWSWRRRWPRCGGCCRRRIPL